MRFMVRTNCEYSLVVKADSEEEALKKANRVSHIEWDQAWAEDEVETLPDPVTEVG